MSEHAKKRLKEDRQGGITLADISRAASSFPGYIPRATRLRGFITASGRAFDLVARDVTIGRLVITVIGR